MAFVSPHCFLLSYVEAVFRGRIAEAPFHVPQCNLGVGEETVWYSKFWGYKQDPKVFWTGLRNLLHEDDVALLRLQSCIDDNYFSDEEHTLPRALTILSLFRNHVQYLRLEEAKLKDEINSINAEKSAELATVSIEESKRVMLRMWNLLKMDRIAR